MANIKETWRHTELPSHWGEGSLCSSISQPIRTQTSLIICKATSFLVALFFFLFSFSVKFHVVQCNMKDEIIISLESGWLCSSIYITISIPHNWHNAVSFHVQMFCIFKKKTQSFFLYTSCLFECLILFQSREAFSTSHKNICWV